ncbi:MAG: FAD-binding oxidoreductase [Albidovulum sp.]
MAPKNHNDLCALLGDSAVSEQHPEYDARRSVWNGTVDRRPSLICVCRTCVDVRNVIKHVRHSGTAVSVRGGGHNISGTAIADNVIMLDLSEMREVTVDAEARLVRVASGATFADIDAATQPHGLAVAGGVVSSTGVGGLTLGGGIGWLARRHGLSIDNLLSAQIVLADGNCVRASEKQHPDLYWALRGGGGNFGVVTEFEFHAHPVGPDVSFGPSFFALEDAEAVLTAYAAQSPNLSRDACVWANLMTAPALPILPEKWHGQKVLTLMQFHAGKPEQALADLTPLYGDAKPIGCALQARSFMEAQSFLDEVYAFGARNYWRTHNHLDLTQALIADLVALAPELPTPESELLICQLGGAIKDVPPEATAFPHRHVTFISTPGVRWRDPGNDARMIAWLKQASDRIATHAAPGSYVNFIAEGDGARDAYQQNMGRLQAVKHQYDPGNMFCVNQNIAPAPPPGGCAPD